MSYIGDTAWYNNELDTKTTVYIDGPVLQDNEVHRLQTGHEVIFGPEGRFDVTDPANWSVVLDVAPNADGVRVINAVVDWINMPANEDPPITEGEVGAPTYSYPFRVWPGGKNVYVENLTVSRSVWGLVLLGEDITINGYLAQPLYRGIFVGPSAKRVAVNNADLTATWCPSGTTIEMWQAECGIGVEYSSLTRQVTWNGSPSPLGQVPMVAGRYSQEVVRV